MLHRRAAAIAMPAANPPPPRASLPGCRVFELDPMQTSAATIGAIRRLLTTPSNSMRQAVGVSHGPQSSSQARREVDLARGVTRLLLRLTS